MEHTLAIHSLAHSMGADSASRTLHTGQADIDEMARSLRLNVEVPWRRRLFRAAGPTERRERR